MNRRAAALLPVVSIVALVAVPLAWRALTPTAVVAASTLDGEASGANLEVALLRAGVSPAGLAAVGAPTQGIFGIVDAARTQFASSAPQLAAADAAYAEAKRESDRLRRLIESGKASPQDVASYQTQMSALATATGQQATALATLFEAATASLSSNQRTALTRIHAARSWGLPTEFLTVERSQESWIALRDALANERFVAKYHEEPVAAAQTLLATSRADATVAAAATGIATNLTYIQASWRSALEG